MARSYVWTGPCGCSPNSTIGAERLTLLELQRTDVCSAQSAGPAVRSERSEKKDQLGWRAAQSGREAANCRREVVANQVYGTVRYSCCAWLPCTLLLGSPQRYQSPGKQPRGITSGQRHYHDILCSVMALITDWHNDRKVVQSRKDAGGSPFKPGTGLCQGLRLVSNSVEVVHHGPLSVHEPERIPVHGSSTVTPVTQKRLLMLALTSSSRFSLDDNWVRRQPCRRSACSAASHPSSRRSEHPRS